MRFRQAAICMTMGTLLASSIHGADPEGDIGWAMTGGTFGIVGGVVTCGLGIAAAGNFDGVKSVPGDEEADWEYPSSIYVLTPTAAGIDAVTVGVAFAGGKSTRNRTGVKGLVPLRVLGWVCNFVCIGELTAQTILAGAGERIRPTPIVLGSIAGLLGNVSFAVDDLVTYQQGKRAGAQSNSGSRRRLCLTPYIGSSTSGGVLGLAMTF